MQISFSAIGYRGGNEGEGGGASEGSTRWGGAWKGETWRGPCYIEKPGMGGVTRLRDGSRGHSRVWIRLGGGVGNRNRLHLQKDSREWNPNEDFLTEVEEEWGTLLPHSVPACLSALKRGSPNTRTPGLWGSDFLKQRRDDLTSCVKGQA